jgi:hypothetical protein
LREAERAERRAEFDRSQAACFHVKLHRHDLPDSRASSEQDRRWRMDAPALNSRGGREQG